VEESFLYCVFRVLVREHDGASDSVRTPLVSSHQLRKRLGFPTLSSDHQCLLALARRVT
jgi:hypothetical protein